MKGNKKLKIRDKREKNKKIEKMRYFSDISPSWNFQGKPGNSRYNLVKPGPGKSEKKSRIFGPGDQDSGFPDLTWKFRPNLEIPDVTWNFQVPKNLRFFLRYPVLKIPGPGIPGLTWNFQAKLENYRSEKNRRFFSDIRFQIFHLKNPS